MGSGGQGVYQVSAGFQVLFGKTEHKRNSDHIKHKMRGVVIITHLRGIRAVIRNIADKHEIGVFGKVFEEPVNYIIGAGDAVVVFVNDVCCSGLFAEFLRIVIPVFGVTSHKVNVTTLKKLHFCEEITLKKLHFCEEITLKKLYFCEEITLKKLNFCQEITLKKLHFCQEITLKKQYNYR